MSNRKAIKELAKARCLSVHAWNPIGNGCTITHLTIPSRQAVYENARIMEQAEIESFKKWKTKLERKERSKSA